MDSVQVRVPSVRRDYTAFMTQLIPVCLRNGYPDVPRDFIDDGVVIESNNAYDGGAGRATMDRDSVPLGSEDPFSGDAGLRLDLSSPYQGRPRRTSHKKRRGAARAGPKDIQPQYMDSVQVRVPSVRRDYTVFMTQLIPVCLRNGYPDVPRDFIDDGVVIESNNAYDGSAGRATMDRDSVPLGSEDPFSGAAGLRLDLSSPYQGRPRRTSHKKRRGAARAGPSGSGEPSHTYLIELEIASTRNPHTRGIP